MSSEAIAWVAGGAAFAVALVTWLPWFRGNLNHDMFVALVMKLLKADNADRARKLCKAAPSSPFVMACDAALSALADSHDDHPAERPRRLREAFDAALRDALARASRLAWLATVSVALGGVTVYMVFGEGASPYSLALVGMALLAIVHARQMGFRIAIAAGTHRDPLIAEMLATTAPPPTVN